MDESEWIGIRSLECLVEKRKRERERGKKNGEEEELEKTKSAVGVAR